MLNDKTPLILIVDDDRTMRSLLNLAMEEEGYRVIEAINGEQCISEYIHFQPDLILLDAVMPDIDGFTCCEKIRSLPGGDRLPILTITVLDDRESVERAFKAGATDYITKPIHWSVLSQRVRSLLSNQQGEAKLAAIKTKLIQEQNWSELVSQILSKLVEENYSAKLIEILNLIRQQYQSIRVGLFKTDSQDYLESIAPGYPSIEKFFTTKVNFTVVYGEQYQQRQIIAIEDISQAELSPKEIEQLKQLKTKSLLVVPINKNKRIVGYLQIHFSAFLPKGLSTVRLLDLANLLTIAIN